MHERDCVALEQNSSDVFTLFRLDLDFLRFVENEVHVLVKPDDSPLLEEAHEAVRSHA